MRSTCYNTRVLYVQYNLLGVDAQCFKDGNLLKCDRGLRSKSSAFLTVLTENAPEGYEVIR